MLIVTLAPQDADDLMARFLEERDLPSEPIRDDAGVRYLLPGGPAIQQSGMTLVIADDDWSSALYALRDLARLATGDFSFMNDEDGLRFGVIQDDDRTPDSRIEEYVINTGPDLAQFAIDVARVMAWEEEEQDDEEAISRAHDWADETCQQLGTPSDQSAGYDITLMAPLPGLDEQLEPPFGHFPKLQAAGIEQEQRFTDSDDQLVIAAVGRSFFLILDEQHQDNEADFASGEIHIFYNDEHELEPARDEVMKIARSLLGQKMPFVRIDVDHNAEQVDDAGYWVEDLWWRDGQIIEEPTYIDPDD